MKLAVLTPDEASKRGHWMEVHAQGCQHLKFRGGSDWEIEAATKSEAASEVASDFIQEGSMTVDDALNSVPLSARCR